MSHVCNNVSELWLRSCFVFTRPDGARFFVKAGTRELERELRVERQALLDLAGLAVPNLWEDPAGTCVEHLQGMASVWMARSFTSGKPLHAYAMRPEVALGVWAFVVEQLAAFRRRGVLLSDLKTDNVIFDPKSLSCVLIDLGGAVPLLEGPEYPATRLGWTPGAVAPEHLAGGAITEAALVFQAGVLLAHTLACASPASIARASSQEMFFAGALSFAEKILPAQNSRLLRRCLAYDPDERPQSFEELHALLALPPDPAAIFELLREPYAAQLVEVLA